MNDTTVDPETGRRLFAQECKFVLAASEAAQFPDTALPEIAFVGRSNVGKSSLVNALTGRKSLARASNTPGRTQQIIFFDLGGKLMLADLPGYGFADAPRAEKEKWNELMQAYLRLRQPLQGVCLLLDGRHGAKATDIEMMNLLDRAAVPYRLVLTKGDQLRKEGPAQALRDAAALAAKHPAARADAILTSSESRDGIAELRGYLASFVGAA